MGAIRKSELLRKCLRLADEICDKWGFVPIKSLAEHFAVTIVFRPLLVEAMLASISAEEGNAPRWVVLVDSDRFPDGQNQYENESREFPLPVRLRNTLAHEILHSLSFQEEGANFRFRGQKSSQESHSQFIDRVENETEELSPLLLVPMRRLLQLANGDPATLGDFLALQQQCAVSRMVLINRMLLWWKYDRGTLLGSSADNLGIGIGHWHRGIAYLTGFPIFLHFDGGRTPHLFKQIGKEAPLAVTAAAGDPDFVLNGGNRLSTELDGHKADEPIDYLKMRIRLSVEPKAATKKGRFLFFVEKLRVTPGHYSVGDEPAYPSLPTYPKNEIQRLRHF